MKKLTEIRNTKMKLQSGLCHYCSQPMWIGDLGDYCQRYRLSRKQAALFQCTAEHLTARCDGGDDSAGNIVAACLYCNKGRHKRLHAVAPGSYRDMVRRRLVRGNWHGFRAVSVRI